MDDVFSSFQTSPMLQIESGAFGYGSPAFAFGDVNPRAMSQLAGRYREAFLFTPGAENFAYLPNMELPVESMRGFIVLDPNAFNPLSRQTYILHSAPVAGIGGLQTGAMDVTELMQIEE